MEDKIPAHIVAYKKEPCNFRVSFHRTPQGILYNNWRWCETRTLWDSNVRNEKHNKHAWASSVIESASSRTIILNGGQGWPLQYQNTITERKLFKSYKQRKEGERILRELDFPYFLRLLVPTATAAKSFIFVRTTLIPLSSLAFSSSTLDL